MGLLYLLLFFKYHMQMKSQKTEYLISRRKPEFTHYVNTCTTPSLEKVLNAASARGGGDLIISLNITQEQVLLTCLFFYRLEQILV
jgi:hypothetical protein